MFEVINIWATDEHGSTQIRTARQTTFGAGSVFICVYLWPMIAFCCCAQAAETGLNPVGLVTAAGGGKLVRAGTETALAARAGDLLFAGDTLRTEGSASSFLFCPDKAIDTLSAPGEVRFDAGEPKVRSLVKTLVKKRPVPGHVGG